jgi:hypothetical protein
MLRGGGGVAKLVLGLMYRPLGKPQISPFLLLYPGLSESESPSQFLQYSPLRSRPASRPEHCLYIDLQIAWAGKVTAFKSGITDNLKLWYSTCKFHSLAHNRKSVNGSFTDL